MEELIEINYHWPTKPNLFLGFKIGDRVKPKGPHFKYRKMIVEKVYFDINKKATVRASMRQYVYLYKPDELELDN